MSPRSRRAVALLTLAYVVLAGAAVASDRFLHDEGLLTHLLAALVGREPAATIFLQKARPPLALLYAPVAGLGLGPFLWMHVLVAATAVPLVASAAARLGQPRPELVAAVVALSPMHIAAGAAGLMNADAVVGVAAVAWLWSRDRVTAAGVVTGLLVWVRAELAVLALAFVLWALLRRRWRAIAGLAAFPLVYGLAGAVYHGDLLWMLHYPPALPSPMEGNPYWESHHAQVSLPAVVGTALAIGPALVLLPLWSRAGTHEVERVGLLAMAVLAAALLLLPRWQVFNFDLSPRYLLPVLPFAALAIGRVVAAIGPGEAALSGLRRGLGLGAMAVLAVITERVGGGTAMLWVVGVASVVVAAAGADAPRLASWLLGGLVAIGPIALSDGAGLERRVQAGSLDEAVARLREHPQWAARPLYTNEPLLSAYLERGGALPGRDVHYLVQADQLHEITALAHRDNGQLAALLAGLRRGFNGVPVMPDELTPEAIPQGAILVLRDDSRLELVMPSQRWSPYLRVVHPGRTMTIAERIDPGGGR